MCQVHISPELKLMYGTMKEIYQQNARSQESELHNTFTFISQRLPSPDIIFSNEILLFQSNNRQETREMLESTHNGKYSH